MSKIDPINPMIPLKKEENKTFRDSLKRKKFTEKPNEEFIEILEREKIKRKHAEDKEVDERD